jgi:hypothetical protein
MRRFAQKKDKPLSGKDFVDQRIGTEGIQKFEEFEKINKYLESEKDMIAFCKQLKTLGTTIKSELEGTEATDPAGQLVRTAILKSCDKLIEIGDDAVSAIQSKNNMIFSSGILASLTSVYQPAETTLKTPGAKKYIPFVGDVVNFSYVLTLRASDFTKPIKILLKPYKCDKSHPPTSKPLGLGIPGIKTINYRDHPELVDQQREKMTSVSSLTQNIASLFQLVETAISAIALVTMNAPLLLAARTFGGLIGGILGVISIVASPNTYDLSAYAPESFAGGGIDPEGPFGFLTQLPLVQDYAKIFESKPVAEEVVKESEKPIQNFKLGRLDKLPDGSWSATIVDPSGEVRTMSPKDTWPKWGIQVTGVFPSRLSVEYKDKYGKVYILKMTTDKQGKLTIPQSAFTDKKIFDQVMKDAADLSSSGVKGDVKKLLSKKMVDILNLVYQLQPEYPWIGNPRDAKWINLQSDILSHITRPIKRKKPVVKPIAAVPTRIPVNKLITPQ